MICSVNNYVLDGRLVAVDVETVNDWLGRVSVSGDFFLEPDEALQEADAALSGILATSSADQLVSAIISPRDPGVQLIGFTTNAVLLAVRRALGKATGWRRITPSICILAIMLVPMMYIAASIVVCRISEGRYSSSWVAVLPTHSSCRR